MSLKLENVTLSIDGEPHIYQTNLALESGSMNILLGPTGAGKTTLMRLMAGLDKPDTGKIIWNGEDVTNRKVQHRDVAMVYQQFINYPSLTVYENIASPLRVKKKTAVEIDTAVRETAALMKLTPFLKSRPLELSGGQQQRCALARALVKGAGLVLLDEPLANLDYKLREELRTEIPKIFAASGSIFVYATTEPEEALLLGGNTATMSEGRITQFGKSSDVYHRPQNNITARIFSNPPMNFLTLNKRQDRIILGDGTLMPATDAFLTLNDGDYMAGFRANHLALHHEDKKLKFDARLNVTEITGSETYIHMEHEGNPWVGLLHGIHDLKLGSQISVYLDPDHIYTFTKDGKLALPARYAERVE
ncbi:MAG TPA: ABC transporter ATP-binding protein [Emcibacteraceae bacterium]|nr:ABC transporter ATP-binding protein [Emcibacteraceae bacterium]